MACLLAFSQSICHAQDSVDTVKAWRYELIADPHRAHRSNGSVDQVPATAFAELLVSEDFSKCVYRYFRNGRKDSNKRSPFVIVVGCDGKSYWSSEFWRRVEIKGVDIDDELTKSASHVFVFPDKETLDKYHERNGHQLFANFILWYEDAHLHQLLNRIGADKWEHESLASAFKKSDACKTIFADGSFEVAIDKYGYPVDNSIYMPRTFYLDRPGVKYFEFSSRITKRRDGLPLQLYDKNHGNWCYLVEIGKEAPFISKCRVQHFAGGNWMGAYPFSTPLEYTIELNPDPVEIPADSFSSKHYSDEDTKLETIR